MKKRLFALIIGCTLISSAVVGAGEGIFSIDGKAVTSAYTDNDTIIVPVREAAEALGFKVEWMAQDKTVTLTKGAVTVSFRVGTDGYTFAKTAPMPLGRAAEIREGKTLVPIELFSEIMELPLSVDGDNVNVITVNNYTGTGTVTDLGEGTITFEDSVTGEVILHIGENTAITDADGNTVSLEDIAKGSKIDVTYSPQMMQSMPPQNSPEAIVLTEKGKTDELEITGTVTELTDGMAVVESDDKNAAYPQVALKITDNTKNEVGEIKAGDKVTATFSPVMTRSIPPQSECIEIKLANLTL